MSPIERQLCRLLRDGGSPWPADAGAMTVDVALEEARHHGVVPLLAEASLAPGPNGTWPARFRGACLEEARVRAMHELAHRAEMARVIERLARADVRPLLLKGTGLAYSHYSNPSLRPRADTDLLVRPGERDEARGVLDEMGYRHMNGPAGEFVGYQMGFYRTDRAGVRHNVDLHWRLSNLQSFAWLFSFDDLAAAAVAVPRLHPLALRLGDAHALVMNLLHRAGNNWSGTPGAGDCLIWHYDIHLLVGQMSAPAQDEFRRLVEATRIGAIVVDGLRHCRDRFDSPRLERLIEQLANGPCVDDGAAAVAPRRLRREWLELCAIPRVRDRLAYLAERAFSAREYMRERYPEASDRGLLVLHARRIFEGLGRMLPVRKS